MFLGGLADRPLRADTLGTNRIARWLVSLILSLREEISQIACSLVSIRWTPFEVPQQLWQSWQAGRVDANRMKLTLILCPSLPLFRCLGVYGCQVRVLRLTSPLQG